MALRVLLRVLFHAILLSVLVVPLLPTATALSTLEANAIYDICRNMFPNPNAPACKSTPLNWDCSSPNAVKLGACAAAWDGITCQNDSIITMYAPLCKYRSELVIGIFEGALFPVARAVSNIPYGVSAPH